ncbi:MAG TPA: alpha-amylase family protein [Miltoncostaeaceae bacterium]|nr:alpha-amylase family protein [Miltoncostaeaceae bacterium]
MISRTGDLWWKNAVVYCLDVETYRDSDGDGCGDFAGLTQQLDHLAGMNVSCVWLMPFYPSPNRDDGYDIVDFYGVQEPRGDLGDVVDFVRTAHDRGMRVIADLVINHTSDRHPWFRRAREGPDSPFHEFYVWADDPPEDDAVTPVFPDAEDSVWTRDERCGRWYLHHFYSHQPDLNVANPAVRDALAKVAGFWLELGLSGFRIDAVPFLIETYGLNPPEGRHPHELLKELRAFAGRRRGDHMLLGEVNLPVRDAAAFFGQGDGDELQMLFAFGVNQAMYLAFARQDAGPLAGALRALPEIPDSCQWAFFVRNHDELSLDQLTDDERQEVFAAFGPDPDLQLYGRGLRRRLPTMLGGDGARIRMAYSLLLSLPGTPVLFYGEEIGMAENLDIPGRMSVRAPMQWAPGPGGGFSEAPVDAFCRPPVDDPAWSADVLNVADQRRDHESLLNWFERMTRTRRECHEIGWGTWEVLDVDDPAVLVHRCDWHDRTLVALHNLAPRRVRVRVALEPAPRSPLEGVAGDGEDRVPLEDGVLELVLGPYGYRWLRGHRDGGRGESWSPSRGTADT